MFLRKREREEGEEREKEKTKEGEVISPTPSVLFALFGRGDKDRAGAERNLKLCGYRRVKRREKMKGRKERKKRREVERANGDEAPELFPLVAPSTLCYGSRGSNEVHQ